MSSDISEICSRLLNHLQQNIKSIDAINYRIDQIEARFNELPKDQPVFESLSGPNSEKDRLDKTEAIELPKDQPVFESLYAPNEFYAIEERVRLKKLPKNE